MRSPHLASAVLTAASAMAGILHAQDAPPPNGPRSVDPGWHALVGARVIVAPGQVLERATVVIRDGRIVSVDAGGGVPDGARIHDCAGRTVLAAWIDAHVPVTAPRPEAGAPGAHWNPGVTPQRSALDGAGVSNADAATLRELGFGAAGIFPADGIVRGRGAVVTLEEVRDGARRRVLVDSTMVEIAFDRTQGGYPSSLMGSIALVRQTLADAVWNDRLGDDASGPETALGALRRSPATLFVARDELDALRGARVLHEFDRTRGSALLGTGTEFRRLDAIAALRLPVVLPLAFPDPPDVETVGAAERVDLRQLQTWEQAPANPARLQRAGVRIALTTDRLDERSTFGRALRRAIENGLTPDDALAALTTTPAALLGISDEVGTVEAGRIANLCVVDGDPFGEDRALRDVWISGVRHVVEAAPLRALAGTWDANLSHGDVSIAQLLFDGEKKLELSTAADAKTGARSVHRSARQIDLTFDASQVGGDGIWKLTALIQGDRMSGIGVAADGSRFAWTARQAAPAAPEQPPALTPGDPGATAADRPLTVPFGAYGRVVPPSAPQTVVVRGATIWTAGPDGILTDGALVARGGRIDYVGPAAGLPEIRADVEIDGAGMHLTPGLIDCHSHTGIDGGINEGTQAVTAEVRVGDVLDPDDINWYRQLAGGITAVNQLHGSANPIGGQSQVVKLRWGVQDPERMKLAGSTPGIKFALGENVKRSRSRDNDRYPNTRMGVEAILRDRFTAAREYLAASAAAAGEPSEAWPRRDLELEALAEILRGERLVHCHSYRQDEILMLCRLAQEFGFRIGTFQHGLEGYKVAEAIREAAIGASVFSDWWAYKYEVVDAIPENAAIMTRVGVNVSFNSDSNELARRMNTEAAKAVKYGGLAPHDALKLVTINPATQLAVADRIGSLEVGKDADFVIWSGDPLSTFSRCLETWIDGRRHWSEDEDRALRAQVAEERARLIQAVLATPGERADASGSDALDNRPGDCECAGTEVVR